MHFRILGDEDTFTSFYTATGAHKAKALDAALEAIKNFFSLEIESRDS